MIHNRLAQFEQMLNTASTTMSSTSDLNEKKVILARISAMAQFLVGQIDQHIQINSNVEL
jgi:hypothetical protein